MRFGGRPGCFPGFPYETGSETASADPGNGAARLECDMRRAVPWLLAVLCTASVATAQTPSAAPAPRVSLPVREVTVYSDRARVVREGPVRLAAGTSTVRLLSLPPTLDPQTVRLEAKGARVVRVEVQRAIADEVDRTEAEKLVREIERLRDELAALDDQTRVLNDERALLLRVRPSAVPLAGAQQTPLTLDPSGWRASLGFFAAREQQIDAALAPLEKSHRETQEAMDEVLERARLLAAGQNSRPGWEVVAVVDGRGGQGTLSLAYVTHGARWYPAYDVRYAPGSAHVDVDFAARVSQETGEDWTDAQLVLSTAVPMFATAQLPRLTVWKIGERDRFIPTPGAQPQPPLPPLPPPVPLVPEPRGPDALDELRQALAEAEELGSPGRAVGAAPPSSAPAYAGRSMAKAEAPQQAYQDAGQEKPSMVYGLTKRSVSGMTATAESAQVSRQREELREPVGFGAPRGYTPPSYASDLPAALAGGYDFTFTSAQRETIASGAQARRVPLSSRRFPADAMVRILPALSKQAYLVAEVRNDGDRPLLRGQASLFVGSDLVGEATLPTTAVGESVTLPLGVDDAIRIERNVSTVASERGFFAQKDVSAYEVRIELMNPRARTVRAVVIDQIPLTQQEDVKIALEKAQPEAKVDAPEGFLEWRLDLPTGEKKSVSFTYSVERNKGAKLWQTTAPKGGR